MARAAAADIAGTPAAYLPGPVATRLKVAGIDLFTMGRLDGEDEVVALDTRAGHYRREVYRRGELVGSIVLGEFNAARGTADTIFSFVVEEAGTYAFRTIWTEGGGGANIEWFTVRPDGTKVLVNDTANGGVRAYRALVGGTRTYIKSVTPAPVPRQINQPASEVSLIVVDGTVAVNDASITLRINGE